MWLDIIRRTWGMADILEHLLSALSDSSDNVVILGGEGRVVILAVCASAG